MTTKLPAPTPGLAFVSSEKQWARFIVDVDRDSGDVYYQTFQLGTGKALDGVDRCSPQTLRAWADRMATSDEAKVFASDAAVRVTAEELALRRQVLERLSDRDLLEDAKRRGLID